ncbi:MAG TPA: PEP-CTERM sorting domain-containing protein [Phycisphaerae bacterium]|nr:PEP-CTERM sorting domain-containing protein [Phycisphaerae bacterium]
MTSSRYGNRLFVSAAMLIIAAAGAMAEPTPSSDYRDLKSDYVQTWYIWSDTNCDGILDPGDTKVAAMNNMWTVIGSDESLNIDSTTGNASPTNGYDYNMDTPEKSLVVYMNYSQKDNNWIGSWSNTYEDAYNRQKYGDANGYSIGMVGTGESGTMGVDIMVHNGAGTNRTTYGSSPYKYAKSNPQVMATTGISAALAEPGTGDREVVKYDEVTQSYNENVNLAMKTWFEVNGGSLDVAAIAAQMDMTEFDAYDTSTWQFSNSSESVFAGLTPDEIANDPAIQSILTAFAQTVSTYEYQDVFSINADYDTDSNAAGVIGGISGVGSDTDLWADQTVIRLDFNLEDTDFEQIIFYDFGYNSGASQTDPIEIIFKVGLDDEGDKFLYYDVNDDNMYEAGVDTLIDQNRLFISVNSEVPEPATLLLMVCGGAAVVFYRRRGKARMAA